MHPFSVSFFQLPLRPPGSDWISWSRWATGLGTLLNRDKAREMLHSGRFLSDDIIHIFFLETWFAEFSVITSSHLTVGSVASRCGWVSPPTFFSPSTFVCHETFMKTRVLSSVIESLPVLATVNHTMKCQFSLSIKRTETLHKLTFLSTWLTTLCAGCCSYSKNAKQPSSVRISCQLEWFLTLLLGMQTDCLSTAIVCSCSRVRH